MNILITTPKIEIDNSRKEGKEVEESGGFWFRTFRFRPKVEIGDRIYFVENGLIHGYGIISNISTLSESEHCDVTGREWGKLGNTVIYYKDWHWLSVKIPFKGFQGIRYINKIPWLTERLRQLE